MFKAWGECFSPEHPGVATLDCITVVFQNVVMAALLFAGIVALFMIILGGIKFLTSGGDPKQVEGARNTLTWAIVGLILILLSFFILNLIGFITGVDLSKFGFPPPAPLPATTRTL